MRTYSVTASRISVFATSVLTTGAVLGLLLFVGCSSTKGKSGQGEGGQFTDEDLALREPAYGEGNIPQAQAQENGLFSDVRFEFNASGVSPEYRSQLKEDAQALSADPTLHAEIEGHCDKRGTNEYNMALGAERAKAVAAVLTSYGVKATQLSTISYGAEIPLDPASSEEAYAKNRRAHFALYRDNERAPRAQSEPPRSGKDKRGKSAGRQY